MLFDGTHLAGSSYEG